MYNAAEYPQGVPNPDYPDVSLYPTYEHGPDYTRPVFGEPWMRQPFNVMSGLGQVERPPFYTAPAYWKGVGAAAGLGVLLAVVGAPRKPAAIAQAAVAFGLVGVLAAAVTYATQPGAPEAVSP